MSRKTEKKQAREKASTRQLIGAEAVTEYSLVTHGHGELVYFIVKPSNISVLSEASVGARIYALMTVLKGVAEIEMPVSYTHLDVYKRQIVQTVAK